MKKTIAIITLVMILISTNLAYAEDLYDINIEDQEYGVMFMSMSSITADLSLDANQNASIKSTVIAYPSQVDRVVMTVKLKQMVNGSWSTINTWNSDVNRYNVSIKKAAAIADGYQYKIVTDVYTYYKGNYVEFKRVESQSIYK